MKASMQNTGDTNGAAKSGDLSLIFQGVSDNIWSQASLHTTDNSIKCATGETLTIPENIWKYVIYNYLERC